MILVETYKRNLKQNFKCKPGRQSELLCHNKIKMCMYIVRETQNQIQSDTC